MTTCSASLVTREGQIYHPVRRVIIKTRNADMNGEEFLYLLVRILSSEASLRSIKTNNRASIIYSYITPGNI